MLARLNSHAFRFWDLVCRWLCYYDDTAMEAARRIVPIYRDNGVIAFARSQVSAQHSMRSSFVGCLLLLSISTELTYLPIRSPYDWNWFHVRALSLQTTAEASLGEPTDRGIENDWESTEMVHHFSYLGLKHQDDRQCLPFHSHLAAYACKGNQRKHVPN